MNKSLSAAITTMLLITSSAWAASPESQAIRPMGDNMPDPSPTEQAEQMRERHQDGQNRGEQMRDHGDQMKDQHSQGRKDPQGEERWKEEDYLDDKSNERGNQRNKD